MAQYAEDTRTEGPEFVSHSTGAGVGEGCLYINGFCCSWLEDSPHNITLHQDCSVIKPPSHPLSFLQTSPDLLLPTPLTVSDFSILLSYLNFFQLFCSLSNTPASIFINFVPVLELGDCLLQSNCMYMMFQAPACIQQTLWLSSRKTVCIKLMIYSELCPLLFYFLVMVIKSLFPHGA